MRRRRGTSQCLFPQLRVSYDYAKTFVNSLNSYNHLLDMGLHTLKVWDETIKAKDNYKICVTGTRFFNKLNIQRQIHKRVIMFIGMAVMFDRLLAEGMSAAIWMALPETSTL